MNIPAHPTTPEPPPMKPTAKPLILGDEAPLVNENESESTQTETTKTENNEVQRLLSHNKQIIADLEQQTSESSRLRKALSEMVAKYEELQSEKKELESRVQSDGTIAESHGPSRTSIYLTLVGGWAANVSKFTDPKEVNEETLNRLSTHFIGIAQRFHKATTRYQW